MGPGNKLVGRAGEILAREFLQKLGYKILALNYRTCFGEIDVIANKDHKTVFIEVKTRTTSSLGPPYIAVTRAKARHIVKSAFAYLKRYGLVDSGWRIDVVSVKLGRDYRPESIDLIENAIEGDYL